MQRNNLAQSSRRVEFIQWSDQVHLVELDCSGEGQVPMIGMRVSE